MFTNSHQRISNQFRTNSDGTIVKTLNTPIFGRPFIKRFALCYRSLGVGTVVSSVCNVGVLWPNGWMDQDEKSGLDKFWQHQLNSTQRASMDAGDKTPQCPHLSSHYFIYIL